MISRSTYCPDYHGWEGLPSSDRPGSQAASGGRGPLIGAGNRSQRLGHESCRGRSQSGVPLNHPAGRAISGSVWLATAPLDVLLTPMAPPDRVTATRAYDEIGGIRAPVRSCGPAEWRAARRPDLRPIAAPPASQIALGSRPGVPSLTSQAAPLQTATPTDRSARSGLDRGDTGRRSGPESRKRSHSMSEPARFRTFIPSGPWRRTRTTPSWPDRRAGRGRR